MKGILLLNLAQLMLITLVWAYNEEEKACWQIRLTDESLFCSGTLHYPVSEETYYSAPELDHAARTSYEVLLRKYENLPGIEAPTNDCLAIARDFYCFRSFRRCRDAALLETPLCAHTCALWLERCRNEDQTICDDASHEKWCTGAVMATRLASLSLSLVALLYLMF